jgi:hypothetical protein
MLDTPLFPVFQGEGRRLIFAAPPIYHGLIRSCVIGGAGAAVYGFFGPQIGLSVPIYPSWWVFTGLAVCAAGALAAYSLRFISFDLKERVYRRRDGSGPFGSLRRGKIDAIDAVVVTSRPNAFAQVTGASVTYRLILFWKNNGDSPMILAEETRALPPGAPLNAGAGQLLHLGQRVATSLQVRLYDNSLVPSA